MTKKTNGEVLDVKDATEALEADRARRTDACAKELSQLLQKYGCEIHTRQEWIDGIATGRAEVIVVAR